MFQDTIQSWNGLNCTVIQYKKSMANIGWVTNRNLDKDVKYKAPDRTCQIWSIQYSHLQGKLEWHLKGACMHPVWGSWLSYFLNYGSWWACIPLYIVHTSWYSHFQWPCSSAIAFNPDIRLSNCANRPTATPRQGHFYEFAFQLSFPLSDSGITRCYSGTRRNQMRKRRMVWHSW